MKDNPVSSNGFPGSFAGAAPVVTNPPPPLAAETAPRSSPRQRLLAALTGRLPRNLPFFPAPSVTAFLAVLAVGLLFLLPGGLVWAQDAGTIEYPEKETTGAVVTYTAVDPEGEPILWSLAAGGDMEDFSIENGVLTFKRSPDFENATGGGSNGSSNTYTVTVQASDGEEATTATRIVTVNVTNADEAGTLTLSTLQPVDGIELTTTLTDIDGGDGCHL